jgi:hypothetical protein
MRQAFLRPIVTLVLGAIGTGLPIAAARAETPDAGEPVSGADWSTRLLIIPTGTTQPASSGYVDVIGLGVAQFQAGATDWLSFGAGTLSLVYSGERPVWVTPKAAIVRTHRVSAAAGTIHYFAPEGSGGLGYVVATVKAHTRAWTGGVIQGYGDVPGARAIVLGVEERRTHRTRFIAEATIFRSGGFAVVGMRRVGRRFTSDLGMAIPFAGEPTSFIAFPVVNFGWRFRG